MAITHGRVNADKSASAFPRTYVVVVVVIKRTPYVYDVLGDVRIPLNYEIILS